jgi:class 3 adenylate cyclase
MLNDVFGVCEAVITECHGDIDKFIGDAVMAVFVDANDAVRAAERILGQALPHLNAARAAEGREPIALRIGMSSGTVIQGDIGTVDRRDLTVIGDVVNIAARIQAATPPNSIAASEATVSRLRTPTAFRPAGEVPVRGKRHLVPLYQHTGFSTPAARA